MKNKTNLSIFTFLLMAALLFSCTTEPVKPPQPTTPEPGDNNLVDPTIPDAEGNYSFTVEAVSNNDGTGRILETSTAKGSYKPGTAVTVEAATDAGNSFFGWFDASRGGNVLTRTVQYTFTLEKHTKIYAIFLRNDFVIQFKDSRLDYIVRAKASKKTGDLTYNDVKNINLLWDVKDGVNIENSVTYLDGIEYLTSLEEINFDYSYIENLSPLANLRALKYLKLGGNKISDISPLCKLTNLQTLFLDYHKISDLTPLRELTTLKSLMLSGNKITDISPLTALTALNELMLSDNPLSGIAPLTNLTALQSVYLSSTGISDISPLIKNTGIGQGDRVNISNNPKIPQDQINALEAKRVTVW